MKTSKTRVLAAVMALLVLTVIVLPAKAVFYQEGYVPCFEVSALAGVWHCDLSVGNVDFSGECSEKALWIRSCATAFNSEYARCGRVYRNDPDLMADCQFLAEANFNNCVFSAPECPPPPPTPTPTPH